MSGMYNVLLGDGQEMVRAGLLSRILDLRRRDFGRLRDAWSEVTDEGRIQIAFYTRNGGGNRPDYADVTAKLQAHPNYLSDADDDLDSTYATYRFSFPKEAGELINALMVEAGSTPYTQEEWEELRQTLLNDSGPVRDMSGIWQAALDALNEGGPSAEMMAKFAENVQILKIDPNKPKE